MKCKSVTSIVLLFCFYTFSYAQKVDSIGAICITVKDLDASIKFYKGVLQFKHISSEEFWGDEQENLLGKFGIHYKIAHLRLGNEKVDLIDYFTTGGRPMPIVQHSNDGYFQHIAVVVSNMEKAFSILRKNNIEFVSTNPQTIPVSNTAAAGIKAFYFHDNDNHTLELIYFPKGKGNSKWQQPNANIFLGVDHTAICVTNTDSSLLFWKGFLSLQKKGESHNTGTEQAHLNNVEEADVLITGMAAASGPGVEFLQYLQPGAGAAYPPDTNCDDLWNWLTVAYCNKIETIYETLKSHNIKMVSKKIIAANGYKQFIARDTDGHAVWFKEFAN